MSRLHVVQSNSNISDVCINIQGFDLKICGVPI